VRRPIEKFDRIKEGAINFSIVIPTFNRAALVAEAIKSGLAWLGDAGDGEILVVDDCSSDGTVAALERDFAPEIDRGVLRLIPLASNIGVIKARNAAICVARGDRLVLLDSDDLMIVSSAESVREDCSLFADAPLIFFRCVDMFTGTLLGPPTPEPVWLDLYCYLNGAELGECIPIIRRDIARQFPFDERLDGWEGLTYARILRAIGPLVVSPVMARRYRSEGEDRLSSPDGVRRRLRSMAKGHLILLKEFAPWFAPVKLFRQVAKILYYWLRSEIVRG
jgi:glycosyltransferase involved in cell wall biosynthesis